MLQISQRPLQVTLRGENGHALQTRASWGVFILQYTEFLEFGCGGDEENEIRTNTSTL